MSHFSSYFEFFFGCRETPNELLQIDSGQCSGQCSLNITLAVTIFLGRYWFCLSWQSGRFRYKRPAVRIQSSAKNYTFNICSLSTVLKRRTQRKQAGNGPFKTITIFMGIRNNELQFQTHFYAIVITLCCTKTNLNGKQIKLLQSYFTNYFFYSISHTLTSFFIFHTHHT